MLEENPSLEKDLKRMGDSFGELEKKFSSEAIKERKQKEADNRKAKKTKLKKKYGDVFGEAIFSKKVSIGMTEEMVLESKGKPKFKNSDGLYYGKKCFNQLISFEENKVAKISKIEGLWIDMPLEMLIASYGKPKDEKKTVTKKGTKSKLYFGARRTRQKTTVYKIEVRVEDDKVVGWRDLE